LLEDNKLPARGLKAHMVSTLKDFLRTQSKEKEKGSHPLQETHSYTDEKESTKEKESNSPRNIDEYELARIRAEFSHFESDRRYSWLLRLTSIELQKILKVNNIRVHGFNKDEMVSVIISLLRNKADEDDEVDEKGAGDKPIMRGNEFFNFERKRDLVSEMKNEYLHQNREKEKPNGDGAEDGTRSHIFHSPNSKEIILPETFPIIETLKLQNAKKESNLSLNRQSSTDSATLINSAKAPPLTRKNSENLADSSLCVICLEKRKSHVFCPCYHYICCDKCSAFAKECPICRVPVTSRIRIFEC